MTVDRLVEEALRDRLSDLSRSWLTLLRLPRSLRTLGRRLRDTDRLFDRSRSWFTLGRRPRDEERSSALCERECDRGLALDLALGLGDLDLDLDLR